MKCPTLKKGPRNEMGRIHLGRNLRCRDDRSSQDPEVGSRDNLRFLGPIDNFDVIVTKRGREWLKCSGDSVCMCVCTYYERERERERELETKLCMLPT